MGGMQVKLAVMSMHYAAHTAGGQEDSWQFTRAPD